MFDKRQIVIFFTASGFIAGTFFSAFSCSPSYKEGKNRSAYMSKRGQLRAYEGAPPVVPHRITATGNDYCLTCHEKGIVFNKDVEIWGKKEIRAKISPHPQWQNCMQCHVIQEDVRVFKENTFQAVALAHPVKPPADPENPEPPPAMPHQLQNRENCNICHLKKTANAEIIPAHGEREYCEACHQPAEPFAVYVEE